MLGSLKSETMQSLACFTYPFQDALRFEVKRMSFAFKKMMGSLALVLVAICLAGPALACTGFAVYAPEGTYYGMNFDYPEVPMRVRVADAGEGYNRFFSLAYDIEEYTLDNAIMNDQGMFTTTQDHYPMEPFVNAYDENYEGMLQFAFWTPYAYGDVKRIRTAIAESKPMQHMFGSVHDLFADIYGDAVILELIDEEVVLTDIEGPYIVMTNFAVDQLREVEPRKAKGYGQDRYITAQQMIEENFDTFDVDKAFEILNATKQSKYAYYPTRYSVVHDPLNLTSYFVLHQNFDQIWQVTLEDGMLRTYKGFSAPLEMPLSDKGVSVDILIAHEREHKAEP